MDSPPRLFSIDLSCYLIAVLHVMSYEGPSKDEMSDPP